MAKDNYSVFSVKEPPSLQAIEKSKSYNRVTETLLSILPKSRGYKKGKAEKELTSSVKVKKKQKITLPKFEELPLDSTNRKRKKSKQSGNENLTPGTSNSVRWILPDPTETDMDLKGNKETDHQKMPETKDDWKINYTCNKNNSEVMSVSDRGDNESVDEYKRNKSNIRNESEKVFSGTGHKHKRLSVDKIKNSSSKGKVKRERDNKIIKEQQWLELEEYKAMYEIKINKITENFNRQILKIRQDNDKCVVEMSRLEELVEHWKARAEYIENQNVVSAKLKSCTRENKNFKEDFEVLKSVIRRLNKEISFYQEKLRQRYHENPNQMPVFSSSDSNVTGTVTDESRTELDEPKKILMPLLRGYDEIIAEKQDLIKDNEFKMERFKLKCQEIVHENDVLHKIIGENKNKGSVSIEEWQSLYDNAILVLEENDLLHDKISILEKKAILIQKTHEGKVSKLKTKLSFLEDERKRLLTSNDDMDTQCTAFTEQIKKMTVIIQQRVSSEEHETSVQECKQLFEDLKRRYAEERTTLTEKLAALEIEKERLVIELTDTDAENTKLQTNLNNLETSISAGDEQMRELQRKLSDAAKNRDMTSDTINEMVELVKTVFAEREAIEASFNEQRALNEQMMTLRTRESELVEELQNKIEIMAGVHNDEIREQLGRISDLEKVLESVGDSHRADVLQLNDLINEKNSHIENLQVEKRQLTEDLETVWLATVKDRGGRQSMSPQKIS